MQSGYKEINENALTALRNEDFDKAQELFRANAKHYPNGCTLNNLGVFFCYCGIRQKNGKQVSAWAQGVKYLRQAAAREQNAVICGNLGAVAFQDKKYQDAYALFREATEKRGSCALAYNMGICTYWNGNYTQTKELLAPVLNKDSVAYIREALGSHPVFPFCFSVIALNEPPQIAEDALQPFWAELHNAGDIYDLFTLLFSLGKFGEAWACAEMLVENWAIDKTVGAMIWECAQQVGADADNLPGYNAARERKTAHAVLRQRIAEFHYAPSAQPWSRGCIKATKVFILIVLHFNK